MRGLRKFLLSGLVEGGRYLWTVAPTDPYLGRKGQGWIRPINVIRWSKPSVQDRLAFFLHGLGETDWRITPHTPPDYRKQVTAWDRREFTDAKGGRRTAWFCPQGRPDLVYPRNGDENHGLPGSCNAKRAHPAGDQREEATHEHKNLSIRVIHAIRGNFHRRFQVYSCELMQIVYASARGLLSSPREDGPLFAHAAQNYL